MDLLIVALATAFVVSTVDYFKYLSVFRIPLAFGVAVGVYALWTTPSAADAVLLGAAASFAALSGISIIDRVISPPVAVRGR